MLQARQHRHSCLALGSQLTTLAMPGDCNVRCFHTAGDCVRLEFGVVGAPVRVTVLRERSYFCFRSAYVGLAAANARSAASGSS